MLQEFNILNKIFQIENMDLNQLGEHTKLTTQSLIQMFMDAENFGAISKYVKTFMDVAHDRTIEYRDKTGTIHINTVFSKEISSCEDLGGSFDACKELAQQYVQAVIDSLHVSFPNM